MSDHDALTPLGNDIEKMTAYCTYCPKMCRFSCPTAGAEGRETVTPWGMMRLLELTRDGSVPLTTEVAETFYHCTGCRRCQAFCRHDNDVPRALRKAREICVDHDLLPPPLAAMESHFQTHHTGYPALPTELPVDAFDPASPIAFWPDCSTVALRPQSLARIGGLLERVLGQKVRLIRTEDTRMPPCCGFPRFAAGTLNENDLQAHLTYPLAGLRAVYTDCPALTSFDVPDSSFALSPTSNRPRITHLFTLLADNLDRLGPPIHPVNAENLQLHLHQSCFHARQIHGIDAIDQLLAHLFPHPLPKLAYANEESPCCGGRLLYRTLNEVHARQAARDLLRTADLGEDHRLATNGPSGLLTTSSMCHCHLQESANSPVVSLLDLILQAYEHIAPTGPDSS